MHDKYGPIVRINPWKLHIRDPEWTDVFKVARRAHKPISYYSMFGSNGNLFTSGTAELHRMRRDAIQTIVSITQIDMHLSEAIFPSPYTFLPER
ncbi:hypothetical protein B0H63DRAFT_522454 [Podospora didyma]|uniref:Cytochrome P450 E-class, group I n=1 Tax=Podospora didyma TaxID=330526 RepID=A0AAE0NP25_9PEZI|nr:hypothetical protein B0H63DRAFT_522454 [Podospora didyma]